MTTSVAFADLRKYLEQIRQMIVCYANAGVRNAKKNQKLGIFSRWQQVGIDNYFPIVGKLNGVSNQIGEYLLQPRFITQ